MNANVDLTAALEQYRAALTGHCYRMLGSPAEADDAVQETMLRAWRSIDRLEAEGALRHWLYRIATRVCLDSLEQRSRRARPMDLRAAGTIEDDLTPLPESAWIEPIPDSAILPRQADPAERLAMLQSVRLAFVAALQHLPPKQRAVLLLTEVLDWSAAEVAESLETSVAAVNSALQRARATLASRRTTEMPATLSDQQTALVERYVRAFERYDMDALTAVLHEDVTMCMPPFALWLRGPDSVRGWMLGRGVACRGSRLVPTAACGAPAFGQYKPGAPGEPYTPWALVVLELSETKIVETTFFLDTERLFPRFGLPMSLPANG